MKIIAHRGNLLGPNPDKENDPDYLDAALNAGFDVEIDVWMINDKLFLGHDLPTSEISFRWIRDRFSRLWIHCKNIESADFFSKCGYDANYFWHQNDDFTITSRGYFWTYPGKQLCSNSIAVLPETVENYNYADAFGVCTDFPLNVNVEKMVTLEKAYSEYVYECMCVEDKPKTLKEFSKEWKR